MTRGMEERGVVMVLGLSDDVSQRNDDVSRCPLTKSWPVLVVLKGSEYLNSKARHHLSGVIT
jgi:hypothetical protein